MLRKLSRISFDVGALSRILAEGFYSSCYTLL